MRRNTLGKYGYWGRHTAIDGDMAARLEGFGYEAIWIGGSPPDDMAVAEAVLEATDRVMVATGVVNIWRSDPAALAASYHRLEAAHPGRFILGIGVGHPESVDNWSPRPIEAMELFLDRLDDEGVPQDRRLLAALGPKMLELSVRRSLGAHPYMTTASHTRSAREIIGPAALLAPEQRVVVETDAETARAVARPFVSRYLNLTNYRKNLISTGFHESDLEREADHVIDALAPFGEPADLVTAINSHLETGADHVCVQVLDSTLEAHREITLALGIGN